MEKRGSKDGEGIGGGWWCWNERELAAPGGTLPWIPTLWACLSGSAKVRVYGYMDFDPQKMDMRFVRVSSPPSRSKAECGRVAGVGWQVQRRGVTGI